MLFFIESIGILTAVYTGMVRARQSNMDFVGAYSAALLTAFGGGTLRDVLLGRHPLFWIANPEWPLIVLALGLPLALWMRERPLTGTSPLLSLCDALGLGAFTASGTAIALDTNAPWFPAALLGAMTATFGGVLRDIICAEVPLVFRQNGQQLYVTCSFTGAWVYLLVNMFAPGFVAVMVCLLFTALFRLAAVHYKLTLPF